MTTSRYLTLYEFNWLPAMYAHITHFGDWTRHLVDKDIAQPIQRQPNDRLIHRISSEIIATRRDAFEPLSQIPKSVWPLAPNQWIQKVAFEMGLAALAGKARSSFDRHSVMELVSVIGTGARSRSLAYLERFPALGTSVLTNRSIQSRGQVIALGGQALCEAIDRQTIFGNEGGSLPVDGFVRGAKTRLALRFPRTDEQVFFSEEARVEIVMLLAEICNGKLHSSNQANETDGSESEKFQPEVVQ